MMKRSTILMSAAAMLVSAGVAAGSASAPSDRALACAIEVDRAAGLASIEVTARSRWATTGEYSFRLRGPGMDINQGGSFHAASDERVVLGSVTVSTGGPAYRATLTVSVGDRSAACEKTI
ncbi:MAG: curli-like amyloid fiber formation chaperone CsgH [Rhizobiaceae bacterium]